MAERSPYIPCVIGAVFCCLLVLPAPGAPRHIAGAFAGENADSPMEETDDPVDRELRRYEAGDIDAAREALESAKSLFPSDPAVSYYLGAIYLREGRRADAISEWRQYVSTAPDSEDASKIRKYLTLLVREEAVAHARQALADEAALPSGPVAGNAVAVMPFHNLGSEALGPLGKGVAAMLISDLSQVPDLQVVERIRLQALLREMDLGASGVVDPKTAPKVGRVLKSGHVVTGSLMDPAEEGLQVVSVMMNTERSEPIDTLDMRGALTELFELEKHIACSIIEGLGLDCDSMPAAFGIIHTRSYRAFVFWARGLDALDAGRFSEAREWFQQAVDEDPAFDLAKESLSSAPLPEMSSMTSLQMISSLSGEEAAPLWRSVYRSMLEENLREALALAFIVEKTEKDRRAGDCLNMALGMGYSPHLVLKTMFEAGGDLELNALCESASASGVMKAVFAKAARDAVSPSNRSLYDIAQISGCPCLREESALAYTLAEDNIDYLPPDPGLRPPPVSVYVP